MDFIETGTQIATAGVFTLFGIIIFLLSYRIVEALAPFDVRKELTEDDNTAVGVMLAGMFIGIGLIIAAAIQG
ncbi:MAG: putative membrane protein [Myxococcota bacterium]|jgi:putative membrane protein